MGFKLVDNKGTKDTKDDEYVVLANERVSNSELAANAIGYRYAKMTAKAIKDRKLTTRTLYSMLKRTKQTSEMVNMH